MKALHNLDVGTGRRAVNVRLLTEAIEELVVLREHNVEWMCRDCDIIYPKTRPLGEVGECNECGVVLRPKGLIVRQRLEAKVDELNRNLASLMDLNLQSSLD